MAPNFVVQYCVKQKKKKKKTPWMTSNNHYITLFEHSGSIHVFSGVAGGLVVQAPTCSRDLVCFGCTQP